MACALPPPGGGGKRGRDTKVSLPLLTPQPFLRTRLPSVARLKARGPQGRLVLQGTPLDRSRAFRSRKLPPCTVWPRTVMRGELRKGNSGHNSVPKANRRTEPSPRNPRFAAHLRCVSAKEGLGSQEGTGNHWCPVPFCPCRWAPASPPPDGGIPAGEHRLPRPPKAATVHAHFERKPRLQRRTAVSAEGIPSADGKKDLYLSFGRRMFRMIATNAAGTIPEPPKISWIACGACARMDIFAPMP